MDADGGLSAWAVVALVAFALLFGGAVWLGLKQRNDLRKWLKRKVEAEGWLFPADPSAITQRGWSWYASLHAGRDVTVHHLAINPAPGLSEAAFTLVTRRYGELLGARRYVGCGLVARLPRSISPPIVALPQTAGWRLFERIFRFDLPAVAVSDAKLAQSWSISSPQPEAAARTLEADAAVRQALIATAEEALGRPPAEAGRKVFVGRPARFPILLLEFDRDRLALIAGPPTVGRQPFSDLEEVAGQLVGRLG